MDFPWKPAAHLLYNYFEFEVGSELSFLIHGEV